jgi:hypothetical protein
VGYFGGDIYTDLKIAKQQLAGVPPLTPAQQLGNGAVVGGVLGGTFGSVCLFFPVIVRSVIGLWGAPK